MTYEKGRLINDEDDKALIAILTELFSKKTLLHNDQSRERLCAWFDSFILQRAGISNVD